MSCSSGSPLFLTRLPFICHVLEALLGSAAQFLVQRTKLDGRGGEAEPHTASSHPETGPRPPPCPLPSTEMYPDESLGGGLRPPVLTSPFPPLQQRGNGPLGVHPIKLPRVQIRTGRQPGSPLLWGIKCDCLVQRLVLGKGQTFSVPVLLRSTLIATVHAGLTRAGPDQAPTVAVL